MSVVFEVLSDSTERYDRGDKAEASRLRSERDFYRTIPSLSDHVLLVQHRAHLEHYARQADGSWVLRESSAGGAITIASLSLTLEVDSVYQGVFDLSV